MNVIPNLLLSWRVEKVGDKDMNKNLVKFSLIHLISHQCPLFFSLVHSRSPTWKRNGITCYDSKENGRDNQS